jgi:gamma-glutamyltranspeptidase/glutathione hydrolase
MSATILARDGQPVLALGSPGSRRIISAVVQVIVNWVDRELPIGEAVAAPRLHVTPEDDDLMMEKRPGDRLLLRDLEERGFSVAVPLSSLHQDQLNPYFGGVHAVAFEAGAWRGAADPRRDGAALTLRE